METQILNNAHILHQNNMVANVLNLPGMTLVALWFLQTQKITFASSTCTQGSKSTMENSLFLKTRTLIIFLNSP